MSPMVRIHESPCPWAMTAYPRPRFLLRKPPVGRSGMKVCSCGVLAMIIKCLAVLTLAAGPVLAEPPRVVSAEPDHGDVGVASGNTLIRIEFDQDMNQTSMSLCGGGPKF